MTTKEDEYKAEICKIVGLAFVVPFGRAILHLPFIELFPLKVSHMLYAFIIIVLAYLGVMLIFKGKEILRE